MSRPFHIPRIGHHREYPPPHPEYLGHDSSYAGKCMLELLSTWQSEWWHFSGTDWTVMMTNDLITPKSHQLIFPHVRKSGIRKRMWNCGSWNPESGILGLKIRNWAQGIWSLKSWNPESKFHWQRLESSTRSPESTARNLGCKTVLDSLLIHEATYYHFRLNNGCKVPGPNGVPDGGIFLVYKCFASKAILPR